MKSRLIYIYSSHIAIRLWKNKGLTFWFHKPYYPIPRCFIGDMAIYDMNEEEGLKYLSKGLDEIISKSTTEQKSILSSYRIIMNEMINYFNCEYKKED